MNLRGIVTLNEQVLKRKLGSLQKVLGSVDVTALQETHGSEEVMRSFWHRFSNTYSTWFSACESDAPGGVALSFKKSFLADCSTTSEAIVPGRVLVVNVVFSFHTLSVATVHDYGLSRFHGHVKDRLSRFISRASTDPTRYSFILLGDLNASRLPIRHINKLTGSRAIDCASNIALPLPAPWNTVLADLVEIEQSEPTRYGAATGAFSWIDRVFVSLPPWLMYTLNCSAKTAWDAA